MSAHPLLDIRNIKRHYPSGDTVVRALDGVSLTVYPGEFIAIMGQSGSGKSTLMNIIGCLDKPTAGTYRVNGVEAEKLEPDALAALRRETFGFIFQRYNLLATATAAENVEISALYAGTPRAARQERALQLLHDLGLGDRGDHRPAQLSGGQQQRVAIARALMNNPPVILADEPTGALDSQSGAEVMALLKNLHNQGRTIILITHDEHVAAHADRIVKIQDGLILSDDQPNKRKSARTAAPETPRLDQTARLGASTYESVITALRALRVNLFRTALTLLGIVIGVAAVITMLAVGNASKKAVLDQISSMGTNLLSIRPGAPGVRNSGDNATLMPDDAQAILAAGNIVTVVPERSGQKTIRYSNTDYATSVKGVGAGFPVARDWALRQGTFFTTDDVDTFATVAVLGSTVADLFFPDSDPIGKFLMVGNIPFSVIGVMESKGAAPWGGDQDDTVYVPFTTAMVRLFGGNYLNSITVKIDDIAQIEDTENKISAILMARHKKEDFSVRNTASYLEMATETQNTLTIMLGTVAAISLLVGRIGVMNIMLVSVTERTREIGIRMATGARMRDIMLQFNTEAGVVCTVGGILGIITGLLTGFVISLFGIETLFSLPPAIMAFGCAVITGLIFGYLPARKAAKLDPVVALSAE